MGYDTVVKKISGLRGLDVLDRGLDVLEFLALVTPHEEHAHLDAVRLRQLAGAAYLLDADAALHGVEDALAAALRAYPDAVAAQLAQLRRGRLVLQAVGARDGLEGPMDAAPLQLGVVVSQPGMADGEHVVGVPHLVGRIALDDPLQLVGHVAAGCGAGA